MLLEPDRQPEAYSCVALSLGVNSNTIDWEQDPVMIDMGGNSVKRKLAMHL